MVIFQPEGGDIYIEGIYTIFLVGGGEIDRDLHNKLEVNMRFDQKALSIANLGSKRGEGI